MNKIFLIKFVKFFNFWKAKIYCHLQKEEWIVLFLTSVASIGIAACSSFILIDYYLKLFDLNNLSFTLVICISCCEYKQKNISYITSSNNKFLDLLFQIN